MIVRAGLYPRLIVAAALFLALLALTATGDSFFSLVVGIALLAGPIINWHAFIRLRNLRRLRADHGLPVIQSLRSAYFTQLTIAFASTIIAALAGFTVLRAFPGLGIPPVSRTVYLLFLAYPLLLMASPAFEWIALIPSAGWLHDFTDWDRLEEQS